MKKFLLVAASVLSLGLASASKAEQDDCQTWTHRAYPVEMSVCSRAGGGSGYVKVTNNGNRSASICWTIVANNGNRERMCHSSMGPGETDDASAYQCGVNTKYGGCNQILLESYKVDDY
ncbi:hypothetical protein [Sideroxydans lithotrophicus]|uniref:hypothetical protein n=1 Tax=Sideroxydans lithotrophicus TaxID=63745 RepID=UPI0012325E52|nr:hypothetical protein [Sideroxydans lithotrophicus]